MNRNETIALRFRQKGTVDWVQETVDKPSAAALSLPSSRPFFVAQPPVTNGGHPSRLSLLLLLLLLSLHITVYTLYAECVLNKGT